MGSWSVRLCIWVWCCLVVCKSGRESLRHDSMCLTQVLSGDLQGYKAQSEMVMESLDRLISSCAARHESLVCEGVHLSLNFVVQLMQRHPTIVPFLIYISNEDKHKERFAVCPQLIISVHLTVNLATDCSPTSDR